MARNRSVKFVSARTAKRRNARLQAAKTARAQSRERTVQPETIGQARVWQRKQGRYEIAGLCSPCAAQAAWGHAVGFQKIHDPCIVCQPIVTNFSHPGPRGSKWRKILDKLEYMDPETLSEWLDEHAPE